MNTRSAPSSPIANPAAIADVVEQAKPHRPTRLGMVPGGPHPQPRLRIAPDERTDHLTCAAGRIQRGRLGGLADERVRIDRAAAALRHPDGMVSNEHRRVDQFKLGECRCRRLDPDAAHPALPARAPSSITRRSAQASPDAQAGTPAGVALTGRAVMEIQHRSTPHPPLPQITSLSFNSQTSTRASRPRPLLARFPTLPPLHRGPAPL